MANKKKWIVIFVVLSLLLLFVFARGFAKGALSHFFQEADEADPIVAYVNNEPITLRALELSKSVRLANQSNLDEATAYQRAFNGLIRNRVLVQEAHRRNLSVSEEEVRAYWARVKEMESKGAIPPEIMTTLEQQRQALGLTQEQYEALVLNTYRDVLLIEKLYQELAAEAPPPTEAEVEALLANQPGRNFFALVPIEFTDKTLAQQVYEELLALSATMSAEQFDIVLEETARRYGNVPTDAFTHQKFVFDERDELPDYARAAWGTPNRALGIFVREDGSAVVYFVLASMQTSEQEVREAVYSQLLQEKRAKYVREVEERLMKEAEITYVLENLPEALRTVLEESGATDDSP